MKYENELVKNRILLKLDSQLENSESKTAGKNDRQTSINSVKEAFANVDNIDWDERYILYMLLIIKLLFTEDHKIKKVKNTAKRMR